MTPILPLIKRIAKNAQERSHSGRREKFFLFYIGNKQFAIPAVDVAEIIMPEPLVKVPEKLDIIEGVLNIRGNIIPIVNLRKRLGIDAQPDIDADDTRIILFLLSENSHVGMVADSIGYRLKEGFIEKLPPEIENSDEKPVKTVVIDDEKRPVFMVDMWMSENEVKTLQEVVETF